MVSFLTILITVWFTISSASIQSVDKTLVPFFMPAGIPIRVCSYACYIYYIFISLFA